MIEVKGGCSRAYVVSYMACARRGSDRSYFHSTVAIPANSEDEASGKVRRLAEKVYPKDAGWFDHFVGQPFRVDHIDWIAEPDWDGIVAQKHPRPQS